MAYLRKLLKVMGCLDHSSTAPISSYPTWKPGKPRQTKPISLPVYWCLTEMFHLDDDANVGT
jgi:hypothetical protein